MSRFPSVPEFANSPQEINTALRAIKQSIEQLAGLRQGESRGAPQVFVQPTQPSAAVTITYKIGDFWIDTSNNTLKYWTGTNWQAFA